MKILHIEDFFHPDAGYQINILPKYMAKMGHEVVVITSQMEKVPVSLTNFFGRDDIENKDKEYTKLYGVKIIRLPITRFISGRAVFTRALFKTIREEKPDAVYVHGNDTLTAMRYFWKSKQLGYPYITDSHMLEMASQNRFNKIYRWAYRRLFTPILLKNNIPVIRTQNDAYVESCLGIPLTQAPWISVGSDIMLFRPDEVARKEFRESNGIDQDAFVVLYAGKIDANKGGMLLAEALKEQFATDKKVVFIVVGKTSGEYGNRVEECFRESKNKILRFPTQKYRDLSKFYQSADLVVFPRQCSLSFYDAQACAVPVLSEDNNINVDRCSYGNGKNFKAESVEAFRKGILEFLQMPKEEYDIVCKNACEFVRTHYSYEDIAKQYTAVLEQAVADFNKKRGNKK